MPIDNDNLIRPECFGTANAFSGDGKCVICAQSTDCMRHVLVAQAKELGKLNLGFQRLHDFAGSLVERVRPYLDGTLKLNAQGKRDLMPFIQLWDSMGKTPPDPGPKKEGQR